jgi:hypothetical protein
LWIFSPQNDDNNVYNDNNNIIYNNNVNSSARDKILCLNGCC